MFRFGPRRRTAHEQTIDAEHLAGLAANPAGTSLYSVVVGSPTQQLTTPYAIVRSVIDPATGKLSNSVAEATYQLDSNASGNDCYLSVLGFNSSGSVLYDGIFCGGPHGSGSTTYNQRSVDLQTGPARFKSDAEVTVGRHCWAPLAFAGAGRNARPAYLITPRPAPSINRISKSTSSPRFFSAFSFSRA